MRSWLEIIASRHPVALSVVLSVLLAGIFTATVFIVLPYSVVVFAEVIEWLERWDDLLAAVGSVILTAALVALYWKQTNIQESQEKLMEVQHQTIVRVLDYEVKDDDSIRVKLVNRGHGKAKNLRIKVSPFIPVTKKGRWNEPDMMEFEPLKSRPIISEDNNKEIRVYPSSTKLANERVDPPEKVIYHQPSALDILDAGEEGWFTADTSLRLGERHGSGEEEIIGAPEKPIDEVLELVRETDVDQVLIDVEIEYENMLEETHSIMLLSRGLDTEHQSLNDLIENPEPFLPGRLPDEMGRHLKESEDVFRDMEGGGK